MYVQTKAPPTKPTFPDAATWAATAVCNTRGAEHPEVLRRPGVSSAGARSCCPIHLTTHGTHRQADCLRQACCLRRADRLLPQWYCGARIQRDARVFSRFQFAPSSPAKLKNLACKLVVVCPNKRGCRTCLLSACADIQQGRTARQANCLRQAYCLGSSYPGGQTGELSMTGVPSSVHFQHAHDLQIAKLLSFAKGDPFPPKAM